MVLGLFTEICFLGFPGGSVGKESTSNAGDAGGTVQSLGQEDPLEEDMATHASILPREYHGQRTLVGYSS